MAAFLLAACSDGSRDAGPAYGKATAELTQIRPRQTIDPLTTEANDINAVTSWWPVTGKAIFRTTSKGVDVSVVIENCRTAYAYPVRVYGDADCSAIQKGSKPWDDARGELNGVALCLGAPGARLHHARSKGEAKPWSLGGSDASNLIGRTIAVLDPETQEPLACGRIEVADNGALARTLSADERPSAAVIAEVAGLCLYNAGSQNRDGGVGTCADPAKVADCAFEHCVGGCLEQCADHFACLERVGTQCSGECTPSGACRACVDASRCLPGFCLDVIACTPPPTPNGPCAELRSCCMRQGPLVSSCLEYVKLIEQLSGDPTCVGTLSDWDFNYNFAYRSPCYPDGGAPEL